MDVCVKIALQGGHAWEVVCDEDDPIVFGLISALPGASLDANLPPDGLIQVESRSGERMFLSRSSLVSVAIRRLPTGEEVPGIEDTAVSKPELPPPLAAPERFAVLPAFQSSDDAALLAALAAAVPALDEAEATPLDVSSTALPPTVADRFVDAMGSRMRALAAPERTGAYLDVRFFVVGAGMSEYRLASFTGAHARLLAFWLLDGAGGVEAELAAGDRSAGSEPQAKGKSVTIRQNEALIFEADNRHSALQLNRKEVSGRILIAEAALCSAPSSGDA